MNRLEIIIVCGFFILDDFRLTDGQVCDSRNYTLIENPRRSILAAYDYRVDIPLCDDVLNEALWYRFFSYAGETVVERAVNNPVPINRCGTKAPIYIRGLNSHPSVGFSTTDATVCANYAGNPCNWVNTIKIHKCPAQGTQSVYFLYKLKTPPGCSLSYCVGERPSCQQSLYWNGFSCSSYFPSMSGFPLFWGPYTTGSGLTKEVYFTCRVQYTRQPDDSNARFRVTFLFDGRIMEHVNVMDGSTGQFENLPSFYLTAANISTSIVLGENHLRGRLGREISCKAESYWDGYEPGYGPTNSTMLSQTKFYAALESEYSSYILNASQGSTYTIVFRSTIPLTCRHCSDTDCCYYDFRMRSEAATSTCNMRWISEYTALAQVYILPSLSQSQQSYGMTFEPYRDDFISGSSSLWRDYLIPPVMVKAVSLSTSYLYCSSVTDPNINTFDYGYFLNSQVGDFYLVRTNQSMEIQVRQEVCSAGSCNCGVIVREGNSAFKISICEKGPWNATVQRSPSVIRLLSQDPVDDSTVYRDGAGRLFSIRMPSGLRVEINSWSPWFNIAVYLPPVYHGKTSSDSMCGNSNGNLRDDVQRANNLDYFRIPDAENYFKVQPQCSTVFNAAVAKCDCANSTTFKCSNSDKSLQMVSKPQDPLPDRWNTGVVCRQEAALTGNRSRSRRSNRETTNSNSDFILDPEVVFPPYSYDPNFGVNVSFTWPTPKGKTELAVTQYCEHMVNSSLVYQDCNASVDVAGIIRACKTDIKVTDEWLPGGAYASIFEENCVNKLAASINSSDADSNSTLNILTSVYERTCANQCSGHGTCVEANCVCNQGYIGTDCGIQENKPPLLTSIIRNGICDVRLRPCDVISVFGSGIISTAALKCRFTDQSSGSHVETNGTFITSGEYSCPVPGTTTHRRKRAVTAETTAISRKDVSMTINGNVFSNSLPYVIFDSTCMQCNDSRTCSQRSDACVINGRCYANAARNTNNRCLQCLPETSNSSWTDTTVVQEWTPCTRQCDYGARSKDTLCSGTTERTEVELCNVTACPENRAERHQGVGFKFSEEDLKKILSEPNRILNRISNALDSFCSTNATICCQSVGISSANVTSVTYTSPNLTTYASGYPMLTTNDTQVKIIVKIDENWLRADCAETDPVSSSIVYADTKLLYDAVSGAKTNIERELGVTIKSIWSPETVTPKPFTPETVTSESVTTETVTSEPVTTEPVTPEPVVTDPVTPETVTTDPVTTETVTTEPVTPESLTTETVTSKLSTPEPVTPELVATEPVTPDAFTPEPITTKTVTTDAFTQEPVTTETVTSKHSKPNFVTPELVATEPVTPKPVATETVTSKLSTPEPVTPELVATEAVTPEAFTPEPVTTKTVTTVPVTPEPVTTETVTSKLSTPKPVTPELVATEPVTPEPFTPEPVTTETVTPKPSALETVTSKPVTLNPVTPKHDPDTPSTASATWSSLFPILGTTCFLLRGF